VKDNATAVADIVVRQYKEYGKQVVLLGHSKGGTDAAATCAMFWGELKGKVRGLILLQAVYGGTPLAAELLSNGQFGAVNALFLGKLASFSNPEVGSIFTLNPLFFPFASACASWHLV
jgi:pimeloyl-ACP methyl ester carboxylesterase